MMSWVEKGDNTDTMHACVKAALVGNGSEAYRCGKKFLLERGVWDGPLVVKPAALAQRRLLGRKP